MLPEGLPFWHDGRMPTTTDTASDLRELIITLTGCDPTVGDDFSWSTEDRCEMCGRADTTAVVLLDNEDGSVSDWRLCYYCLAESV
jgi:hypothetical protein